MAKKVSLTPLHDRVIVKTCSRRGENSGRYHYSWHC